MIAEPTIPVVGTDIYEACRRRTSSASRRRDCRRAAGPSDRDPGRAGWGWRLLHGADNEGNAELMHVTIDDRGIFHLPEARRLPPRRDRPMRPLRTSVPRSRLPMIVDRWPLCGSDPRTAPAGSPGWTSRSGGGTNTGLPQVGAAAVRAGPEPARRTASRRAKRPEPGLA